MSKSTKSKRTRKPINKARSKRSSQTVPKRSPAKQGRLAAAAAATSTIGQVISMLQRPKGASIAELCEATGWQAHSVRGAMSGAIRKKLGLTVTSDKIDGVRRYRLAK
ncbi:MAG TPA: DUF3489 domain-containing protein [Rhizomicrobium sp.]